MSLFLGSLLELSAAQVVNGLALFFGLIGAWLLVATRLRQARALTQPSAEPLADQDIERLHGFFNAVGGVCLALALLVSWFSTGL
ncbi:hypothetical protein [Pseudomonas sp. RIT-PI-AD]|uniref:hypothetical protein n=1 Tax=Pseudomonas sp. RIT-PI-AD TaxID=3035294 RepID=UPI0021DB450E|nr:hypothetical protein [Pseudomonas sp. RIT-PI-AD]